MEKEINLSKKIKYIGHDFIIPVIDAKEFIKELKSVCRFNGCDDNGCGKAIWYRIKKLAGDKLV